VFFLLFVVMKFGGHPKGQPQGLPLLNGQDGRSTIFFLIREERVYTRSFNLVFRKLVATVLQASCL